MSAPKFTPGPWRVGALPMISGRFAGNYAIAPQAGPSFAIMIGSGPGDLRKANSNLIAAAPELYDALADCIAELEAYEAPSDPMDSHNVRLAKARAALAKAVTP